MSGADPKAPVRARLALFDLDHTLLSGDSDVLWVQFLIDEGLLDRAQAEARNAEMEAGYRAGTVTPEAFCAFFASTLGGRSPAEWAPWRERFMAEVVRPRIPAEAHALVRRHQQAGDLVVMTTATNRCITELTAREFGIEHLIATELALAADGRYSGHTAGVLNMREGKVTRLHAWLAARGQRLADYESTAYSDSANDLPLLGAVDHPVAVDPDDRLAAHAAAHGWPVLRLAR